MWREPKVGEKTLWLSPHTLVTLGNFPLYVHRNAFSFSTLPVLTPFLPEVKNYQLVTPSKSLPPV
jgi:hypothetical protein